MISYPGEKKKEKVEDDACNSRVPFQKKCLRTFEKKNLKQKCAGKHLTLHIEKDEKRREKNTFQ